MIAWLVSFQSINILVDPRIAVRGKGIVHIGKTTTVVSLILLWNVLHWVPMGLLRMGWIMVVPISRGYFLDTYYNSY